jgi:flagellar biosynthesis protein FliR/FlhB
VINTAYFMAVLLVSLRMFTFFIVVPIFFPKGTPNMMKVLLVGILAFILMPGVDMFTVNNLSSNYDLFIMCFNEIITGLTLGFITNLSFSVIRMAGQLMDMSIGFSMLSMFDPNSNSNVTLIERLLYWLSFILFFIIDGHHMLIRAVIESFNSVALGKSMIFQETIMLTINAITQYFAIGLKIAIPIVLIILITDITLGLLARTVPQLNVMILGLPVKLLVGLTCLTFTIPIILKGMLYIFNALPEIYSSIFKAVPMVPLLIFASEDKTEEATPRKKSDARKKGQIAKSKEVSLALTLLTSTIILTTLGGFIGNNLKADLIHFLSNAYGSELSYGSLNSLTVTVIMRIAIVFLPVVVPIMVMGVVANYIQTGFLLTSEPIKPKLSKLNPLSGFKRMFSSRTVVELIKDILIITIIGFISYSYVKDNILDLMNIGQMSISVIPAMFGKIVLGVFTRVTITLIIIALIDYIYQRFMHNKDLRMTKQEIKEEFKQDEGDPQLKSKIKQKQREMAMKRMMTRVPDATVVVTNPTHLAVALRYQEGKDSAPKVVAKGSDYVAIKIKEIAKENNVPILENKPLARLIFNEIEVDEEVPASMYQAVAEILALVYKLNKKKKL